MQLLLRAGGHSKDSVKLLQVCSILRTRQEEWQPLCINCFVQNYQIIAHVVYYRITSKKRGRSAPRPLWMMQGTLLF